MCKKLLIVSWIVIIFGAVTLFSAKKTVCIDPYSGDYKTVYSCLFCRWEEIKPNWLMRSVLTDQSYRSKEWWIVDVLEFNFSLTEVTRSNSDGQLLYIYFNYLEKHFSKGDISYTEYSDIITQYRKLLFDEESSIGASSWLDLEVRRVREDALYKN